MGGCLRKSLIGFESVNNQGSEFTVIKDMKETKNGYKLYMVEFSTGSKGVFDSKSIKRGCIKDKFYPSICGVGFIGNTSFKENKQEYNIWSDMIHRCYNKKHHSYVRYGGRDVSVCERWHCFESFLQDLPRVNGFDKTKFLNGELELDKDKSGGGIYSLELCEFLTVKENHNLAINKQKISFIATSPNGEVFEVTGLNDFCRNNNQFSPQAILYCLNKSKKGICKGWKFKYK